MVHLTNISFIRDERHILDDVNLHVNPGEHWVILGRNGSGKTTILNLMTGYEFPSKGKVEVLGNKYGECDVREVRRKIGIISQSLLEKMNLNDPVWEAVATGQYAYLRFYQEIDPEVAAKAISILQQIGLGKVTHQRLGTLSQGERKKVMLARALMSDPELLILDEPCSGLDLFEREKLLTSISEMSKGMTIIYVTHHLEEMISMFTHVALIENGRLFAAGPKKDVLTADNLKRVFDVSVEIEWYRDRPWIKVIG